MFILPLRKHDLLNILHMYEVCTFWQLKNLAIKSLWVCGQKTDNDCLDTWILTWNVEHFKAKPLDFSLSLLGTVWTQTTCVCVCKNISKVSERTSCADFLCQSFCTSGSRWRVLIMTHNHSFPDCHQMSQ